MVHFPFYCLGFPRFSSGIRLQKPLAAFFLVNLPKSPRVGKKSRIYDQFFCIMKINEFVGGGFLQSTKSFKLDACRGSQKCPNALISSNDFLQKINSLLEKYCAKDGPVPYHSLIRASLSCCPNSCSQPQIRDFGLQAKLFPGVEQGKCTRCGLCVDTCQEAALKLDEQNGIEVNDNCVGCGQCVRVCPTGSLHAEKIGWTLMVGGKLGRHPRLGTAVGESLTEQQALDLIELVLQAFTKNGGPSERLGAWLERTNFNPNSLVRTI